MVSLVPHKKGKIIAVADIGSGSVGLALLSLTRNAASSVLAADRVVLSSEERSEGATIAALAQGLVEAAGKIAAKNTSAPEELYCVIHAPWVRSRTTRAYSRFEKETSVTEALIGSLAQQALGQETELDRNSMLEASVTRIELNGYPVGEPEGKSALDVGLTALLSDCNADLRLTMLSAFQHVFPQLTPIFRSSTRALLSVLRERPNDGGNHLIVEVGSEATNLVVICDGVILEQRLIGEGIRSILQRIAPTGMPEETLNLIRMLENDECSTDACTAAQEAMARAEPEMVRAFGEGMAACAAKQKLPNRLVLIAHPDVSQWLSRFFARIDFTQFTQTTQPFTAQSLSLKELESFIAPEKGVSIDAGLALSAALVNIEKNHA